MLKIKIHSSCEIIYTWYILCKIYFKDVSREFDEFRVNTHICKLRCWYLKYTMWVNIFNERGSFVLLFKICMYMFCFFFTIMVGVGIFTLGGEF